MTERYVGEDELLYPAEDAQEILKIAIAQQTETGELSRLQLLEICQELGISSQTLTLAEQEWQLRKHELADQKLFDRQRRQRFQTGLARFSIFGGFFLILNLFTGGGFTWLLYFVFAPWALKLAWDTWRIYYPNDYSYRQEFENWRRKKQVKQAFGRFFRWLSS